MADQTMKTALLGIEQSTGDKGSAYQALLANIKAPATTADDLNSLLDSMLGQTLNAGVLRELFTSFVDVLAAVPNHDTKISVGNHALNAIQASHRSYEEADAAIRNVMATAYEEDEDFEHAAEILANMPLESSQRKVTEEDKVRTWIRIVRNYLEVDDSVKAEMFLNKAKNIMYMISDRDLNLHFKLSQARIQDSNREFLAAAQGYQDISFMNIIAEEERLHTLSMAIKCAVLAPAGPARSRALGRLYKDERATGLKEYGILEKMFLDRLLAPAEVEEFAGSLQPHQLAKTADGSTVLARAVVEHNLLGASRLYSNIGFDALGALLGTDGDKAEETTAKMIEQGRLVGKLDQIDRIIWFESGEATGRKGSGRAQEVVGKELKRYDANVEGLAEEVEKTTSALQARYPVSANACIWFRRY